ncbi:ATP-binding protein [Thermodesulfobacteriota bacterium]
MQVAYEIPSPEDCSSHIFNCSGRKFDPETAKDLWPKILQHKWVLSEKLNRDVGLNVACLDFVENVAPSGDSDSQGERLQVLRELGAHQVDRSVWDTISESQPPKQIIDKRIILPLTELDLARKHGVTPPRAIIFFGPPGTGKTHFVRAISGVLQWWYVEVSPSSLTADGVDRLSANLKRLMDRTRDLDEAVVFIDEFEEIAGSRDQASRLDKSVTNELLKQVPRLKAHPRRNLLVCATNYIRQLDAALLRPGRFDCIIPVGTLDDQTRRKVFEHYLSTTNHAEVDVEKVVSRIPMFNPADIEYLFQKVKQEAFEREYVKGEDYRVTTASVLEILPSVKPTLTPEVVREFEEDCEVYTRY